MGKMYTLKPDESINDHVKDSIAILNHIVELSISCMRDLANPHEDTFVDMTYNDFMYAIEHARSSIEMLDELCDELEEDKDGIRQEYEEKVIQFFNRFMNSDLTDEHNYREGELARLVHQLDNRCFELNKELEQERERSNQLEKRLKDEHERYMKLREAKEQSPAYWKAKFERMQKKYTQLDKFCGELETEIDFLRSEDAGGESTGVNNPANFCGNCKHFDMCSNDVGVCARLRERNKFMVVDPDDASCSHFESNQVDRDKPDQPCCKECNRDDCDDCTLCPF